jgi:DNA mismatch repair protein MutL
MQSRPIQQLSPSLVNRIAAGEVIERPAAVVKELVENALDSGATQIHVEVEDGGRALVRVIDDGQGIPPGELPLAFASHATSKLSCDDDLFRISTMGFRGEALASIGAVSQARILSRVADSDVAYEIVNNGGAIGGVQAAAGNRGTTVEVRNLFFNTPARRKFIKGSPTEFGHISETLIRLALPFAAIAFRLTHNGRVALDLPAASIDDRLLAAWPDEFREQRLPLAVRDAELSLRGLIGLPELARPTAKYSARTAGGVSRPDRAGPASRGDPDAGDSARGCGCQRASDQVGSALPRREPNPRARACGGARAIARQRSDTRRLGVADAFEDIGGPAGARRAGAGGDGHAGQARGVFSRADAGGAICLADTAAVGDTDADRRSIFLTGDPDRSARFNGPADRG